MGLNYERIEKIIKAVRIERGLSQADLAEHADLSVPYISHIETGRSKASFETIINIADALNVTVDRLLCGNMQNSGDYSLNYENYFPCSTYEKSIIFDTANSVKKSLRMNKELLFKKRF